MPEVDEKVINLRFNHYQARLIETINMVLEERRRIKLELIRAEARSGSQTRDNQQSGSIATNKQSRMKNPFAEPLRGSSI
jgi:hypothetical protein